MLDFVKPRTSYPLLTFVKILWPLYVLLKYRRLRIELSDEVEETFQRLKQSSQRLNETFQRQSKSFQRQSKTSKR